MQMSYTAFQFAYPFLRKLHELCLVTKFEMSFTIKACKTDKFLNSNFRSVTLIKKLAHIKSKLSLNKQLLLIFISKSRKILNLKIHDQPLIKLKMKR